MSTRHRNNLRVLSLCLVATIASCGRGAPDSTSDRREAALLLRAIETRSSKAQVEGEGVVIKVLPDDRDGDRHQRFIIRLPTGQTLLISHNIDLAPRIPGLREGDRVAFNGEYEWNERGGVLHWTHRDPQGRHPDGWFKHNGSTYQ